MSKIHEGMILPNVVFKTRVRIESDEENPFTWKDLTTADYFAGKKCILFSLPGAFTPTCSSSHLPKFNELYDEFKNLGIDEVYCLSVNDAFVMRKWGLDQGLEEDKTVGSLGFKKVKLIPDGACLFTRGVGMSCTWESERGFGERSWRYSALIDDCVVKKVFVEEPFVQNSEADPYEVSNAETMMNYLNEI
jgi:peroxiredoxin